jgi:hypothetical protein
MDAAGIDGESKMTKDRENEIKQMGREEQKDLLFALRRKNSSQVVPQNQPTPMHNARELVAVDEEIELLENLLNSEENSSTQS